MIIVIGNGQSKFVVNPKLYKNHLTYGCDFVYRKHMPDHLVCQDVDAQLELITNKHTRKNKCYFRGFGLIPSTNYDMLRQTVDPRMKIGENSPKTENFISTVDYLFNAVIPNNLNERKRGTLTSLNYFIYTYTNFLRS